MTAIIIIKIIMYMINIKFKQLRYDGFGMSSQTGMNQTIRRPNIYIAES